MPLEIEDYGVQPMADASPPKWHLAHTSWFFETFLLKQWQADYQPFHELFEFLFNSYYNGVGKPFPRPQRGMLSRPTVAEVYAYRRHVDEHMLELLRRDDPEIAARTVLGLNHEQQHQELLLTDLKYNLGNNPLLPPYQAAASSAPSQPGAAAGTGFVELPGGLVSIGADAAGGDFTFDNETPRHEFMLRPYGLASRPVSNGEYLAFMEAGGYEDPALWLSDGWAWLASQPQLEAPLYWHKREGAWHEYRLSGLKPLALDAPVCHVSLYEADAFARWRGHRLPLEQEWEAAAGTEVRGNFLETGQLHPQRGSGAGLEQMFGDVWEWTASPYSPYPGFRPLAGTLGEYNGKFMSNQLVLRGGSCASAAEHVRRSYRNFFYPGDRWQFSGIRLATDLD